MCASYSDIRKIAKSYDPSKKISTNTNYALFNIQGDIDSATFIPVEDVRLRKLLQLMDANPVGNINDWALAFNLSNSHLQRLFKRATGIGLGQALAEKRLLRAAHLLTNTSMSIKEIASAVGYEHTSSFTRAFERRFELAPRHFRMRNVA